MVTYIRRLTGGCEPPHLLYLHSEVESLFSEDIHRAPHLLLFGRIVRFPFVACACSKVASRVAEAASSSLER